MLTTRQSIRSRRVSPWAGTFRLAPFIINSITSLGICLVMLDGVEELISQPDAPNLY